jgi:hypothetical protein
VAKADQYKIISATRNTEISADASNGLALHIAGIRKKTKGSAGKNEDFLRFATIHRHIRTQEIKVKGFTPHFKVGCLVTGGIDCGNSLFECRSLQEQITVLQGLFLQVFGIDKMRFLLQCRGGHTGGKRIGERVFSYVKEHCPDLEIAFDPCPKENNYYKGLQFKMLITFMGREWEIADGGFVDWTEQLCGNKKERLLISGFGLDFLVRLHSGLV